MRIAYVAKHGSGGNDDEGAILHAMESLGHTVLPVAERRASRVLKLRGLDLVLFHKWDDWETMAKLKGACRRAFWYFDLVEWPDATLEARNAARRRWMANALHHVERGFCTDGDWVQQHPEKLVWLMQGVDNRCLGVQDSKYSLTRILFTGIGERGGVGRASFVKEMRDRYGELFRHVDRGLHGDALGQAIADHDIVVAPDSPVTDRYWSNRVYLTLGRGGFLLHPRCAGLEDQYRGGIDIAYYDDRKDLHDKIRMYLANPDSCMRMAASGLVRTAQHHTYQDRVRRLLEVLNG